MRKILKYKVGTNRFIETNSEIVVTNKKSEYE